MDSEQDIKKIIDEIFERELDSPQINMLRRAVLQFTYTHSKGNSRKAAEAVSDFSGVSVSQERLRKFARNINYGNSEKDQDGSKELQYAIAVSVTHPDVCILNPDELIRGRLLDDIVIPIRLSWFFGIEDDQFDRGYDGSYQSVWNFNNGTRRVSILDISSKPETCYFTVVETLVTLEGDTEEVLPFDAETGLAQTSLAGWGVYVRQDALLVIIKGSIEGNSFCYISLNEPSRNSNTEEVEQFKFLKNKHLAKENDSEFSEFIAGNIHYFQRVENSSGQKQKNLHIVENGDENTTENRKKEEQSIREREIAQQMDSFFTKEKRFQEGGSYSEDIRNRKERMNDVMDETLGKQLIQASEDLDVYLVRELLSQGAPVNYPDPNSGATAFHYAAAHGDWGSLHIMLETGECNLLLRDKRGRLASQLAAEGTGNMDWSQKLMKLEEDQGKVVGVYPGMSDDMPISQPE